MSYPIYMVPAGDVLPHLFATFDGGTGASITMTGLAVTDIEVYKDGSVTQRASDAGYTLLDTDGIDFDGLTGIHGFSIDTGDNTDAGFYTVGSWFHVVVSAITVDAQTVSFVACAFRLMAAETGAGVPVVDADYISHDQTAAANLENAFDDTAGPVPWLGIVDQGTAQSATATTLVGRAAGAFADNTIIGCVLGALGSTQGYWQFRGITDVDLATDTFTVDAWTVTPSGTITYKIFAAAPASSSAPIPVNLTHVNGSAIPTPNQAGVPIVDASYHLGTLYATPTVAGVPEVDLTHVAGATTNVAALATNVDAILTDTAVIGATGAGLTSLATQASVNTIDDFLDTEIAAIKAKTDSLTFTVANVLDANIQRVNDVALVGDGAATPWGP